MKTTTQTHQAGAEPTSHPSTRIPMEKVDDAWTKVVAKEARHRFVLDMSKA